MAAEILINEEQEWNKIYDQLGKTMSQQDKDAIAYLMYEANLGLDFLTKPLEERTTVILQFAKKYASLPPKERQQIILKSQHHKKSSTQGKIKKTKPANNKSVELVSVETKEISPEENLGAIYILFFNKNEQAELMQIFNDPTKYKKHYTNIGEFVDETSSSPNPNIVYFIKTDTEKPEPVVAPVQSENMDTNLQNTIIVGDFDCKGYIRCPQSEDDIKSTLKILPLAVYGKLICSNWNHDLFYEIETFPYAKSIDCSYSIGDLYDLYDMIQRLPTIKGKIVTTQIIIQNELMNISHLKKVLKKDPQEDEYVALDNIVKFLKKHPDLQVVSTGGKNLMASIDATKEQLAKQNEQKQECKPTQDLKPTNTTTQWTPSFIKLDKIMSDLRVEQPDVDFSVLGDDDIQNIAHGMKPKFVKTDTNGHVIEIRSDGVAAFHTQITNAVKAKAKEINTENSEQPDTVPETTRSNTQHKQKQRTLWITQSVLDTLKEYNGQPFKDRIKWLQSLSNPTRKFKIQSVEGIKNGKAYELTPEKTFKGGMRLYVPSVEPEQMLAFCLGTKNTQRSKDLANIKASASLFTAINDELKKIDGSVPQTVIHGETLYKFNAPETRKLLGIENHEDKSVQITVTRDVAKQAEQTGQQAIPFQQAFSANKNNTAEKAETETKQNSRKVQDTNKNTDQTEQPHTEHKTIKSARFIVSQLREKYDCNIDQDLFMLLVNKYNASFQEYLEHHDGDLYEIKRQIEELSGYIKNNIPHLIGKWKTSEQAAMLYYNDQYKIPRGVNVYDLAIVLSNKCRELGVNDETKNYFAESGNTYFWNITNLPTFIKTYLPNFVRIPKESTLDNTQATSETPQQTNETNWITIEELAERLQTTPDVIRQVNNQYKVSHNHPDWTSGRQKWRFNAAKVPDYEQEYGDIIREITQLKSANNSGIPQEPAPDEQPTPVDVAITPGPKSESGTKFDGMLGVKALTTKLDAMMKLIDQKLKEKEDTEHEIQTLGQEISKINDQAIAKIQANDIDSATELLNQTKQKKRELEEAKERVKQLDQNIAELRAQSNEASEKLRRFQQAQEKQKAAEQAVQIANEEARKANEDLQQFLENGFNLD